MHHTEFVILAINTSTDHEALKDFYDYDESKLRFDIEPGRMPGILVNGASFTWLLRNNQEMLGAIFSLWKKDFS